MLTAHKVTICVYMQTPNSVTVAKQKEMKAQRRYYVSNTLWWLLKDSSRLLLKV